MTENILFTDTHLVLYYNSKTPVHSAEGSTSLKVKKAYWCTLPYLFVLKMLSQLKLIMSHVIFQSSQDRHAFTELAGSWSCDKGMYTCVMMMILNYYFVVTFKVTNEIPYMLTVSKYTNTVSMRLRCYCRLCYQRDQ